MLTFCALSFVLLLFALSCFLPFPLCPRRSGILSSGVSRTQFQLVLHEVVISSSRLHQLFVGAALGYLPFFQHDYLVGVPHRAEPVGHYDHSPALEEFAQIVHYCPLVAGVERVGGLVEEDESGVLVDGPGYKQALLLPRAEPVAVVAYLRVVAKGQAFYEIPYVGSLRGPVHFVPVGGLVHEGYVARNGIGKDEPFLHHGAAPPSPGRLAVTVQGDVPEADPALYRGVKTEQELQKGALAAAARAHYGRDLLGGDGQGDVVENLLGVRPFVLEHHVPYLYVPVPGDIAYPALFGALLVLHVVYLPQPLEAYPGVLGRLGEPYELLYRGVELAYDVLHRHHHAEGHVPLYDRFGGEKGYEYVLGLVDERGPYLLVLVKRHALKAHLEQLYLYPLPFPTFLFLAAVELYLLHAGDKLHHVALVGGALLEPLVVEFPPPLEEKHDPAYVHGAAQKEYHQYPEVVHRHDGGVHYQGYNGEDYAYKRIGQKGLYPVVVAYPLHDVAHHLNVEERYGKLHQLDQEIRYQRYADPAGDVEVYPAPQEAVGRLAQAEDQLGHEHHHHERHVAVADTGIHERLGQEGKSQAYDAGREHAQHQLAYEPRVRPDVAQKSREVEPLFFPVIGIVKFRCGFQKQGYALFNAVGTGAEPASLELLLGVLQKAGGGVGDLYDGSFPLVLFYAVNDHEMALVPVDYTGQRNLVAELFPRKPVATCAETYRLGGVADAQHGNAFPRYVALPAQIPQRVRLAVMLGHHAQTGGTAVHGIELFVDRKISHTFINLLAGHSSLLT